MVSSKGSTTYTRGGQRICLLPPPPSEQNVQLNNKTGQSQRQKLFIQQRKVDHLPTKVVHPNRPKIINF